MTLYNLWNKIGKQPIKSTNKTDAIVFIDGKEYKIAKIKYESGKIVGFEVERNKL